MEAVSTEGYIHGCEVAGKAVAFVPLSIMDHVKSLSERIIDCYNRAIDSLSKFLERHEWTISHYLVASLLGEPVCNIRSGVRMIMGWQKTWEKHGFFDVGHEAGIKKLSEVLEAEAQQHGPDYKPALPLFVFHGTMSSPDIFLPWADQLEAAEKNGEIGHVISLQLPDEMAARMQVVRKAIQSVSELYSKTFHVPEHPVNLMGHSRGGMAAHMAAFDRDICYDTDKVDRRWHTVDKKNPLVHKVIAVAAPTWLCCEGMKGTRPYTPYYPESSLTDEQKQIVKDTHDNIFDLVATLDAINPQASPLPAHQVHLFKHKHVGIMTCPDVLRVALDLLQS